MSENEIELIDPKGPNVFIPRSRWERQKDSFLRSGFRPVAEKKAVKTVTITAPTGDEEKE